MPTRSFEWRKSASIALFPGTGNVGSGAEKHLPIGTNSEGKRFRGLIRFQQDFSNVESIVKATLTLKGTSSTNHITKGGSGTLRVARLNGSFSDAGGSEGLWRTDAGTVWSGPGWGNAHTFSINPANDRDHELDITGIVTDWWNGNATNYGLMVDDNGGSLAAEFGSGRASNIPTLVIEYTSATKPTVEWLYPDGGWVPTSILDLRSGLHWTVSLGTTDTQLVRHEWSLTVGNNVPVASGDMLQPHPAVIPHLSLDLPPDDTYRISVTVEGNGGAGPATYSRTFRVRYGEAVHAVDLGVEPSQVGVSRTLTPTAQDTYATAYALSTSGDESGMVTGWQSTPPNDAIGIGGSYFLLIRSRAVRGEPTYVPLEPDGIDRYRVSWRRKA